MRAISKHSSHSLAEYVLSTLRDIYVLEWKQGDTDKFNKKILGVFCSHENSVEECHRQLKEASSITQIGKELVTDAAKELQLTERIALVRTSCAHAARAAKAENNTNGSWDDAAAAAYFLGVLQGMNASMTPKHVRSQSAKSARQTGIKKARHNLDLDDRDAEVKRVVSAEKANQKHGHLKRAVIALERFGLSAERIKQIAAKK